MGALVETNLVSAKGQYKIIASITRHRQSGLLVVTTVLERGDRIELSQGHGFFVGRWAHVG